SRVVKTAKASAANPLLAGHHETRVAHAEGPEDAPIEDRTERNVLETGDEEPEQVGRVSVMKAVPRLIDQGQPGQSPDPVVGVEGVVDRAPEGFEVGAGDRAPMELAVRQARAVREEIAERDRPRRRIRPVQRTLRMTQDAQLPQLRRMTRD